MRDIWDMWAIFDMGMLLMLRWPPWSKLMLAFTWCERLCGSVNVLSVFWCGCPCWSLWPWSALPCKKHHDVLMCHVCVDVHIIWTVDGHFGINTVWDWLIDWLIAIQKYACIVLMAIQNLKSKCHFVKNKSRHENMDGKKKISCKLRTRTSFLHKPRSPCCCCSGGKLSCPPLSLVASR